LKAAQIAARTYVDQMRAGDQAGLLAFNTEIDYVQPVTADRAALANAIDSLKAKNDTVMYDALAKGVQILDSIPGRKAVIVLTDGLDNRSTHSVDQVFEQIGPGGLSISTIGLGDPSQLGVSNAALDEAALKSLAERAGGNYGYAEDPETLRNLYERFGRALQSEYVLTYNSPTALRDGVKRTLSVSLARAGTPAEANYNPGGVVPEVPRRATTWMIFGVMLAGLLVLLFGPVLFRQALIATEGQPSIGDKLKRKGSHVRLHDQSSPAQPRIRVR
jgi:VWFA-related protein